MQWLCLCGLIGNTLSLIGLEKEWPFKKIRIHFIWESSISSLRTLNILQSEIELMKYRNELIKSIQPLITRLYYISYISYKLYHITHIYRGVKDRGHFACERDMNGPMSGQTQA